MPKPTPQPPQDKSPEAAKVEGGTSEEKTLEGDKKKYNPADTLKKHRAQEALKKAEEVRLVREKAARFDRLQAAWDKGDVAELERLGVSATRLTELQKQQHTEQAKPAIDPKTIADPVLRRVTEQALEDRSQLEKLRAEIKTKEAAEVEARQAEAVERGRNNLKAMVKEVLDAAPEAFELTVRKGAHDQVRQKAMQIYNDEYVPEYGSDIAEDTIKQLFKYAAEQVEKELVEERALLSAKLKRELAEEEKAKADDKKPVPGALPQGGGARSGPKSLQWPGPKDDDDAAQIQRVIDRARAAREKNGK
jgi:hypothetical protein